MGKVDVWRDPVEKLKGYLDQYLTMQGIHLIKGRTFSCINPEHVDQNPSCGLYLGSAGTPMFHCFSCGAAGSIFEAAHFLEDKPLSGHGFLMDTVPHLAQMFGVEIPRLDLNPEDLYEMETYQAYQHAAYVIRNSTSSERVQARLAEYSWSKEVLAAIGIGSVASYDDYLHRMTVTYGHKREFLKEVDLDRKSLFNENNLIYTVKDEHGSPVGFAARDLLYEEKQSSYDKQVAALAAKFASDDKKLKEEKAKLFKPRKYNNSAESELVDGENGKKETRPKNTIYKKGTRLFNFDLAKKATPPLEVFEGQPDCVTAYAYGMKNATAIGSTHFTADHLDLILNADPPIKHLIFTLDADEAGKKGTDSFVKLLEEKLGGHPGLKVEIRVMPDGSDDPDKFIRTCGIKAFRELIKEDLFSWRIKKAVENGEDPVLVANDAVALILNETNMLFRREMTRKLSRATGQAEDVLWSEVMRRVDTDKALQQEQKSAITERMMQEIRKHPERSHTLIAQASTQMELVDKQRQGYDVHSVVDALDFVYDRAERNDNRIGLYTGYPIFDERMRGIPRFEKFIAVPGKPNIGKALTLDSALKTPTGWKLMRDAKVGDPMASVDGQPSEITGVFPQGIEKVYRVTFSDDRTVECSGSHLWEVRFVHEYKKGSGSEIHNGPHVFTTDAIRTFCLNGSRHNGHRAVYVPLVSGDFGNSSPLPVDPWLLGALLGDGGLTNCTPIITSADKFIVDKVQEKCAPFGVEAVPITCKGKHKYGWRLTKKDAQNKTSNPLTVALTELGIYGLDSSEKFIPSCYLNADKESRWQLLQGWMDGHKTRDNATTSVTVSKQLALDLQALVRSLGGLCRIQPKKVSCMYKGVRHYGKLAYCLWMRIPQREKAFSMPRKMAPIRKNQCRLTIKAIDYIGEKETQCITVSHPSKLFITDGYAVTHNSTLLDNLAWRLAENNPDCVVLFHTADDSLYERHSRIMGSKFDLPSELFEAPLYFLNDPEAAAKRGCPNFEDIYSKCKWWLRNLMESERLIVADVNLLPPTFPALGRWANDLRKRFPDKYIVVLEDNFHLLELPGFDAGEAKVAASSHYVKRMCTNHQITVLATMEITKGDLTPGKRPVMSNLKGSSAIPYDINANFAVHNDLADLLDQSQIYWEDEKDLISEFGPNGEETQVPTKKSILEVVVDKNKISGFKGTTFFKMKPESGHLDECSEEDQGRFRSKVLAQMSERRQLSNSRATHREGF